MTSLVLIRVHNTLRKRLFTPNEDQNDPCPIPVKFLDIMRRTDTSNSSISESNIDDYWTSRESAKRELTDEWTGRTMFYVKTPPLEKDMNIKLEDQQGYKAIVLYHQVCGLKNGDR